MNENEFNNLLDQITAEVLRRLGSVVSPEQLEAKLHPERPRAVVLVPGLVPFAEKAMAELQANYGEQMLFVTFTDTFAADRQRIIRATHDNRDQLMEQVAAASDVVMLAPALHLLGDLAESRDKHFAAYLFLRAQLWGKRVSVFLDFDLPNRRRSDLQNTILDKVEVLEESGIPVVSYRKEHTVSGGKERGLITEDDVVEAYRAGRRQILCAYGSIITPLAKDKASELGMEIREQEVF